MAPLTQLESRQSVSTEPATERISSPGWTWYFKRFLPIVWFAIAAIFQVFAISEFARIGDWGLLFAPLPFAVAAFVVGSIFWFPLADDVLIDGEGLFVRKGRIEERIPFARIVRVAQFWHQPETIRVEIDPPGPLGRSILFAASPQRWCFLCFWDHPLVARLSERASISRTRAF
jgi:hypothetical protein